jgi:hypothetical protein
MHSRHYWVCTRCGGESSGERKCSCTSLSDADIARIAEATAAAVMRELPGDPLVHELRRQVAEAAKGKTVSDMLFTRMEVDRDGWRERAEKAEAERDALKADRDYIKGLFEASQRRPFPVPLTWVKEPPTVAGWYLVYDQLTYQRGIYPVGVGDPPELAAKRCAGCLFAGPLPEPEAP